MTKSDILKSIGFGLFLFVILFLCVKLAIPAERLTAPEGVDGLVFIGYADLGKSLHFIRQVNKRLNVPIVAYPDTVAPIMVDKKKFDEAVKLLRENKVTVIDPKEKVK